MFSWAQIGRSSHARGSERKIAPGDVGSLTRLMRRKPNLPRPPCPPWAWAWPSAWPSADSARGQRLEQVAQRGGGVLGHAAVDRRDLDRGAARGDQPVEALGRRQARDGPGAGVAG